MVGLQSARRIYPRIAERTVVGVRERRGEGGKKVWRRGMVRFRKRQCDGIPKLSVPTDADELNRRREKNRRWQSIRQSSKKSKEKNKRRGDALGSRTERSAVLGEIGSSMRTRRKKTAAKFANAGGRKKRRVARRSSNYRVPKKRRSLRRSAPTDAVNRQSFTYPT